MTRNRPALKTGRAVSFCESKIAMRVLLKCSASDEAR
jgi:hypothetical protein